MNGITRVRATLGRTLAAVGLAAALGAAPAGAAEGDVSLVAPGAEDLSLSADGSVVAFSTTESLVEEDTGGNQDVYVALRDGGSTTFRLISHRPSGQSGDYFSSGPEVSADGSTVAFFSLSDSLVDGDDNDREDVFVADVASGAIERVNVGEGGAQAGLGGLPDARPSLSADGSQVAFTEKDRLTPGAELSAEGNVYVRDRDAGTTRFVDTGSAASISGDGKLVAYQNGGQVYTSDGEGIELVSRSPEHTEGDGDSGDPDVSADGGKIAYSSFATNLLAGEDGKANPGEDIFLFDRGAERTELVSLDDRSRPALGSFSRPSMSGDGGVVAFSAAANPNGCGDPALGTVAVRDIDRESTYSAARARPGELPDGHVGVFSGPSVAADGKHVGYPAYAANLVDADDDADGDGFVTELGALEDPTVFSAARDARARETDGALEFDLGICHRAGRRVPGELVYATEDGTAGFETDYVATDSGVVEFTADEERLKVSVPLIADGDPERCETLFLRAREGSALLPASARGVIEADGAGSGPVYFQRDDDIFSVRPCGEPERIAEGSEPAVSPDGEHLAFVRSGGGEDQLVVAGTDGTDPEVIAGGALGSLGRPAWSPDGKAIAFGESDQDEKDPRTDISIADAAAGGEALVAEGVQRAGRTLSFSPDGKLLAFDRGREDGSGVDVTTLAIDSGAIESLGVGGLTPSYGPDGSLVYVRSGTMRILAPDGTERVFSPARASGDPSEFGHERPSFSPDGTAIVFVREDGATSWIETAALAGGPTTALTTPRVSDDHNPAWGPGGPVVTPPPTVSVADASAAEGSELGFTVTLSATSSSPVTVTASTSNATATSGADYTSKSETVTIPAGSTGASFNVQTAQDTLDEPDETLTVTLSGPSGAVIADGQATGTIVDDDDPPPPPPSARLLAPEAVDEGGVLRFPVRLSSAAASQVSVVLSTRNGSAAQPGDYTQRINQTVTIAAGEIEAFFEVQTKSDLDPETNETVNADIESASGATVGSPSTIAGTIREVPPPRVTVHAPAAVDEGGVLRFPVRLAAALPNDVMVLLSTSNGSATAPSDYTSRFTDDVVIEAGDTEAFFEVQTKSDLVVESDETVNAAIDSAQGALVGSPSSASGTIRDVPPPRATVHAPAAVDEGGVLQFPVRLVAAVPRDVTVVLSTSDGSALAGSDYTARITDEVVIEAGATEAIFEVHTTDDTAFSEIDETVNASIDSVAGGVVASPSSATGTIRNRPAPAASVGAPAAVDEGAPLRFPVTISRAIAVEAKVRLSTVDLTATAGSDYTARSQVDVTIAPGTTQAFFEVQTIDDPLVEPDETVKVEIRGGGNISLGSPASATGTIRSTDLPPPAATIGTPAAVDEGAPLRFPVAIARAINVEAKVRLSTVDLTATAGSDYTARSLEEVVIPPGQTQAFFEVQTIDDPFVESDETVKVDIRGGGNISLGSPASATGTIRSTDIPPPAASVGTPTAVEEGTALKFPVTISRAINVEAKVRLSTKDGTATAGNDYTGRSLQEVTIPPGQTQATFDVDTLKDSLAETDETVTVEIRGGGNISLGSPSSATGTIRDPAPLNIVRGETLGAQVVRGSVAIRLPQTKAPLDLGDGALLPVGTIVDATNGTIELISAVATSKATLSAKTQRARFSGGVFTIRQKKGARLVTLVLSGRELRRCPKSGVRRLQGDGKGAFAVQGRFAAAAVRSGRWLTEDRCGATTVKVQRGSAKVRDLVRKRTKTVRSGRSLTVRKR